MANVRIVDLTAASSSDIDLDMIMEVETSGGTSRKITLRQLLNYLGIRTLPLGSLGASSTQNEMGFATDALKFGETTGNGSGTLVLSVDTTAWQRIEDSTNAVT